MRRGNPPAHKEGDKVTLDHRTEYGKTPITGKVVEIKSTSTVLEVKYKSGTLTGEKYTVEVEH